MLEINDAKFLFFIYENSFLWGKDTAFCPFPDFQYYLNNKKITPIAREAKIKRRFSEIKRRFSQAKRRFIFLKRRFISAFYNI